MTDRPIIFSAPMIRAMLDGRKTQTRRVLKPWPGMQAGWLTMETLHRAPTCYLAEVGGDLGVQMQHPHAGTVQNGLAIDALSPLTWVRLPYAPGDRLWVREAWAHDDPCDVQYRAGPHIADDALGVRWRSPIHMPRRLSRLTLTVTDVRVQRLQDISDADAMAEGCKSYGGNFTGYGKDADLWMTANNSFRSLWNSIHGSEAWGANPWVIAVSFRCLKKNIDT